METYSIEDARFDAEQGCGAKKGVDCKKGCRFAEPEEDESSLSCYDDNEPWTNDHLSNDNPLNQG